METWEADDPAYARPIAAPLEQCAELLGLDLATIQQAVADIEPYVRVDGTKVWSLMQLERHLHPEATGGSEVATSPADGARPGTIIRPGWAESTHPSTALDWRWKVPKGVTPNETLWSSPAGQRADLEGVACPATARPYGGFRTLRARMPAGTSARRPA